MRNNIYIVGSIKINSLWRLFLLWLNVISIKKLSFFRWRLNIVGRYAKLASHIIKNKFTDCQITFDNQNSYFSIVDRQLVSIDKKMAVFFWLEDHIYVCQSQSLFVNLLDQFFTKKIDILTCSHLTSSWERKDVYPILEKNDLFKVYNVNSAGYQSLSQLYPGSYLTGIPCIFSYLTAKKMLLFNRHYLGESKHPGEFEIYQDKAKLFLSDNSLTEMVPSFHIFREVFLWKRFRRAIGLLPALLTIFTNNRQKV